MGLGFPQKWADWLYGFLALALFVSMVLRVEEPYSWDESAMLAPLVNQVPRYGLNHRLAHDLAAISIHSFGLSKWSARLPSMIFTTLLLVLLPLWLRRFTSRWTACFVALSLLVNGYVQWFSHSARGYSPMILSCFLLLAIAWEATVVSEVPRPRLRLAFFALLLVLSPLFHTFSLLFSSVLWLALATWTIKHRANLAPGKLSYLRQLLYVPLFFLPLLAAAGVWQLERLAKQKWLFHSAAPHFRDLVLSLPYLLGHSRVWASEATLVAALATAVFLWRRTPRVPPQLLDYFVGLAALVVLVTGLILGPGPGLQRRFFLAFLIPFLIWWLESIRRIEARWPKRIALAGYLMFTVAFSWHGASAVYSFESNELQAFEAFFGQVAKFHPAPLTGCYQCTGPAPLCGGIKLHLEGSQPWRARRAPCTARYHFDFRGYTSANGEFGQMGHPIYSLNGQFRVYRIP